MTDAALSEELWIGESGHSDAAGADAVAARDARLVQAARADANAYRPLVAHHQARVYATVLRLLCDERDAQDAAQEAFLRGYRNLARFELGRRFGPWICTIAANVARDQLRHPLRRLRRGGRMHSLDAIGALPDGTRALSADVVERAERCEVLAAALTQLAPKLREALVLRYVADMSTEEVACALGIGSSATKMRIKRGLEQLEAKLASCL